MTTQIEINSTHEYPDYPDYQIPSAFIKFFSTILSVAFVFCGAFLGYFLYGSVKSTIVGMEVSTLPYIDFNIPVITSDGPIIGLVPQRGGEIPLTSITGVPLPDYDKKERVNILLLGIDKRPDEQFSRTDTMILVTVDPENYTTGMLSIPRDLWVDIPGYHESRINTAYYFGDKLGHPEGGPALAMQTVQHNLGVPVHFYIKVDFDGFRKIIDTLGGIEVDVPYTIDDPTFPDQNYGHDPFYISAGQHVLDGETTLKYARTRKTPGSDFGRATRQQQVLIAIKEKALHLDIIPRIPNLWGTLAGTVETNLQLVDILTLAELGSNINPESVESFVINDEYTEDFTTDFGAMVLLPLWGKIQPLVDSMFAEVQVNGMTQAEIDALKTENAALEQERLAQEQQRAELRANLSVEGASVAIQNGTRRLGLEVNTATFLTEQGFQIDHFGPADIAEDYTNTVIVDYSGKEYTLGTLARFFNVAEHNIRRSPNPNSHIDIRVIIGNDFQLPEIVPKTTSVLP